MGGRGGIGKSEEWRERVEEKEAARLYTFALREAVRIPER